MRTRGSVIGLMRVAVCAATWAGWGCSPKPAAAPTDPMAVVKNTELDMSARVAAVDRVWAEGGGTAAAREALKSIAWAARSPGPVRLRALELILADPADAGQADARNMMRLMLPVEPDMAVVEFMCRAAGTRGWGDLAGPLVRSYARRVATPPDAERPERAALLALFKGEGIERIVFRVFAAPAAGEGRDLERAEKARTAAWEVLSRLDADGSIRAGLLDGETSFGDALVESLRACRRELGAVPLTSSQLQWLTTLRDTADVRNGAARKAWWAQAAAAVARLRPDQRDRLALRHAEAVRLATAHRLEWLALDRSGLAALLRDRLQGRPKATRGGERENGVSDSFIDNEGALSWADMLTILLVDDAAREPSVVQALFSQSEQDRADVSTEYGGLLRERESRPTGPGSATLAGGVFTATLYPPRATQRTGDTRFVASDDMLNDGATALAHYHFHAQRVFNADYAGPGPGDAEYAIEQGRACVVFTSLREGVLNANYYHAGMAINLGEVRR